MRTSLAWSSSYSPSGAAAAGLEYQQYSTIRWPSTRCGGDYTKMKLMLDAACGYDVPVPEMDYTLIGDTFWLKMQSPECARSVLECLQQHNHMRVELVPEKKLGQRTTVQKKQILYKGTFVAGAATLFFG
eukprot:1752977-Karenia_brevis.AAC.1